MSGSRKIFPPVYFLAAILIMTGLHFFVPIRVIIDPPANYLGVLPVTVGLIVVIWAASAFGKAGTPIKPFEKSTSLVTGGLYRFTRNPMYLGMVLVLLGVAILFGTISPFFPIPIFVWIIQMMFIRFEEAALEKIFGSEYTVYKHSVRRWL